MAGSSIITAMTIVFAFVTLAALAAAIYRFRRAPVAAMVRTAARRAAFHRDAVTALESAIASARAEGKDAEAAALEPSLAAHRRAVRNLAAAEPFAGPR